MRAEILRHVGHEVLGRISYASARGNGRGRAQPIILEREAQPGRNAGGLRIHHRSGVLMEVRDIHQALLLLLLQRRRLLLPLRAQLVALARPFPGAAKKITHNLLFRARVQERRVKRGRVSVAPSDHCQLEIETPSVSLQTTNSILLATGEFGGNGRLTLIEEMVLIRARLHHGRWALELPEERARVNPRSQEAAILIRSHVPDAIHITNTNQLPRLHRTAKHEELNNTTSPLRESESQTCYYDSPAE